MATVLPFRRPAARGPQGAPEGAPVIVTVLLDGVPFASETVPPGYALALTIRNARDGSGEATLVSGPATSPEDA